MSERSLGKPCSFTSGCGILKKRRGNGVMWRPGTKRNKHEGQLWSCKVKSIQNWWVWFRMVFGAADCWLLAAGCWPRWLLLTDFLKGGGWMESRLTRSSLEELGGYIYICIWLCRICLAASSLIGTHHIKTHMYWCNRSPPHPTRPTIE